MTCLDETLKIPLIGRKKQFRLITLAPLEAFARLIDSPRFSDLNEAGLLLD